jgi:hypothetical protein
MFAYFGSCLTALRLKSRLQFYGSGNVVIEVA